MKDVCNRENRMVWQTYLTTEFISTSQTSLHKVFDVWWTFIVDIQLYAYYMLVTNAIPSVFLL